MVISNMRGATTVAVMTINFVRFNTDTKITGKSISISTFAQNREKLCKNILEKEKATLTATTVQINTDSLLSTY